jgi:hypothetical protein
VKGSVLPDEPAELCEEVVLALCEEVVPELTELGADWESVDEFDVVDVVDVPVLVLLDAVL